MKHSIESEAALEAEAEPCLARSVAKVLQENPALEAVTFKPDRQTISVATIGNTDVPRLTERLWATVKRAQEADKDRSCLLLAGTGDCHTCEQPLSEREQQKITIRHDAGATGHSDHAAGADLVLFAPGAIDNYRHPESCAFFCAGSRRMATGAWG